MRRRQGERGMALIWAMLLVVAFGAFSASMLARARRVDREALSDLENRRSFFAAQGGLAWARVEVARNLSRTGHMTREIDGFRVVVTVEPTFQGWDVESRAHPGGAIVSARLLHRPGHRVLEMTDWQRVR